MQLSSGTYLQSGKYRILRVLGQGGFGITYLAENILLDKKVAIKEFFPKDFCGRDDTSHLTLGTQNNAETVERLKVRFLREAKNIARLDHQGIVKIHDVFEENNTAYYVMDFIEGENLNEMVKRNGPLPVDKALEYIVKIGEALEYIHSRNMTHFDVKPANIVVRASDDNPILIDFGLSKQYDAQGDATSTLMQGISHGYSPIELYNLGCITTFSPQTDVYSLGATLYYLLSGTVPPAAAQLLEEGLSFPDNIPNSVRNVIETAMTTSRSKRYQTVAEFCEQLMGDHSIFAFFTKEVSSENQKNNATLTEEDTQLLVHDNSASITENDSNQNTNIDNIYNNEINQYGCEEEAENEYSRPSKFQIFITRITGTATLVDTYGISSIRKVCYGLTLLFTFILTAGFGWIFWIFLYRKIISSLKYLFFPSNISEWDYAYDYTKSKAIKYLMFPMFYIALISFVIISSNFESRNLTNQAIVTLKNAGIINFWDIQANTNEIKYTQNTLTINCVSNDSLILENDSFTHKLNEAKIQLTLPYYIDKYEQFNQLSNVDNIILNIKNVDGSLDEVSVSNKYIKEYKNLKKEEKARFFLDKYTELVNYYLYSPYSIPDTDVVLRNLKIITTSDNKYFLQFSFDSLTGNTFSKEKLLPYISMLYEWPAIITNIIDGSSGISYKVNSSTGILKTTGELILEQAGE